MMGHYDIIGDVHGYAETLELLLDKLGYENSGPCWKHAERTAVFVGDLIDRGPGNFKALEMVKNMTDNGCALIVMGNHEYNALCFHTRDDRGRFLRPHNEKNIAQHKTVLTEIDAGGLQTQKKWAVYLEWFRKMPLFLELKGFRVVHACWDPHSINFIKKWAAPTTQNGFFRDNKGRLTDEFLVQSARKGSEAFDVIDVLLKGEEIPLPEDHPGIYDKDNNHRKRVRLKWWIPHYKRQNLQTYDQVARVDPDTREKLMGLDIPGNVLEEIRKKGETRAASPIFIGHYWFSGEPRLLTGTVASLDYSVAKGGPLVCYRWDGEKRPDPEKFVCQ